MTKEESKALYQDKYFYEIIKSDVNGIRLFGPYDNIYYVTTASISGEQLQHAYSTYKYVQIIDGVPIQAFSEYEILVTDRKL